MHLVVHLYVRPSIHLSISPGISYEQRGKSGQNDGITFWNFYYFNTGFSSSDVHDMRLNLNVLIGDQDGLKPCLCIFLNVSCVAMLCILNLKTVDKASVIYYENKALESEQAYMN